MESRISEREGKWNFPIEGKFGAGIPGNHGKREFPLTPVLHLVPSKNQFTFAQNRPKSDISGALGPIHNITLKAFAMASGDGTKCKTCFGGPRMILHAH